MISLGKNNIKESLGFYSHLNFLNFDAFSDSGFGGGSGHGGGGIRSSSSKRDVDGVESPRKPDMDGLTPFEKNFYVESAAVAAMSEKEVEQYRERREITVEGRDVPKPVPNFRDVGLPGTTMKFGIKKITSVSCGEHFA